MNKKICHISTVHNVRDTRILYRECKTLADNGNEVSLVIPHEKDETIMGVHIRGLKKSKNRFIRVFFSIFSALKTALKTKSRIYHFHDPELLPAGILLRIMGKKVIYDIHENVPAQILHKKWLGIKVFRFMIAGLFALFEKFAILFCSRVVSAEPELAKRFPKRKTVTIRNLPVCHLIEKVQPAEIFKKNAVLIYAGGLTRIRGIKEIILAAGLTRNPVELRLLGKWESSVYEEECRNTKGWERVTYLGFVSPEEVYAQMKAADIGLCMLYPLKNHVNSLPIKTFEYAGCGLTQIISDFPYFKEYYRDIAHFAHPHSPAEIANKIDEIVDSGVFTDNEKNRLKSFIKEKFSWEKEQEILLKMYQEL